MLPAAGDLMFGISVTPYADNYEEIVNQVLTAERVGLDVVGIQDHPYQRRFLDTFALIANLLAVTERISFFPDVTSLPMRPPAMIAKAAASMDVMSGARFELGLGAGGFWDAIEGMGGQVRARGERLPALDEALTIIRDALDVGPERRVVRSAGPYYPAHSYPPGPPPRHRVEIWVGAMAPGALRLIGRKADGWVAGGGISRASDFPILMTQIDEAATAAGRDPRAIRRIVNVSGPGTEDAGRLLNVLGPLASGVGIDGFVYWPADFGTDQIERFAAEVAPALRR
jgi:alkanesulfonate monooxygenase SsuD/methylene tetrahydromethanopterin reductase-like flavin-dependent oxidoreductase (luciferase family)